jgi:hypothetical protein
MSVAPRRRQRLFGGDQHVERLPWLGHPRHCRWRCCRCACSRRRRSARAGRGHQPGASCHGGPSIDPGQECSRVHAYYIKTGKLRALAVTSATRSEVLPDIPAVAEFVPAMRLASGSASVCPRTRPPRLSTSSIRRSTRASPIPVEGTFRGPCTLLTRSAHPEGVAFALRRPDHCSVGDGCGGKCVAGAIDRDSVSRESSYMPAGCERRAADSGRGQF